MKSSDSRFTGWVLAGALALLLVTPLAAQRTTGQISGTVEDPSGAALPGVTVSLNGPTVVGTRTTETNASGFYRFLSLPPGRYQLSFSLESFATQTRDGVRVSLGATTVEDATLRLGDVEETITVIADASVVDTSSNEVGANYGRDWVENAPVGRSSFNDLVAAAPGSLQAGEGEFDTRRTMVYGSSFDENLFQLDGVDINDNFFNTQTALPNIDAIEEVEVLSLGAPAEYGNVNGAVYNIVTRQGTNQFHGDLNVFTQSDSLTSRNTSEEEDGGFPFQRDELLDYSAQLGGRLVEDRLWFFASFQHQEEGFSSVGNDPSIGTIHPDKDRYFGKLNLQLNPSHSLQLTYHQDDAFIPDPLDPNVAPSAAVASDGTTPAPGVGYSGVVTDKTLVEVRATGFYADIFPGPPDDFILPRRVQLGAKLRF